MSQAIDAETNGPVPTDVGPRQGSYEGVKVAPGGNSPPLTTLQTPQISSLQQNQPQQNFPQRPPQPIRRTDSRSSISYRPPFPNQVPVQQPIGAGIRPPPQQLQPRPPPPGANFVPQRPVQRFPLPGTQQQPQPIRYQYDPQPQDGNFRRAVNTVFQRPPSAGPRAPGIYQQKSLPQQQTVVPEPIKKSYTLDNSEVMAHSTTEENGARKNDIVSTSEKSKYDDLRSSSSLGFNQDTNGEKDIDTTLNGKSFVKEDIPERPESRTGLLSRDHSSHSSMQKIDEDDDDAVITPARTFTSGSIRSGKSSISNSSDNISQKSLDLNKPDITKSPISPEIRKETKLAATPPKRNSTENIMQKSLDIESSNIRATTPLPPESPEIKKASPLHTPIPPTRTTSDLKPMNLTTQEKVSRTPSPLPPMKQETPRSMTPELRPMSGGIKSQVVISTSPVPNKDPVISSPSPRNITPSVKKSASPRVESKSIVNGRRTPTSKIRKEGDNDSGVDESTQGNDRSLNGEQASPKKTPSKLSKVPTNKCKTPTKMLHSPKSPDPANSLNTSADKKVPMNKVQVGAAPSPNIKQVKSKIGSLENANYKPGGGKIKVENRKVDFSKVQPKIAAKNDQYSPGGGDKKSRTYSASRPSSANNWDEIQQQKLQWNAKSKIGSLDNSTYKPGGGDKKIESVKLDFKDKAKPKVGSKDNIKHTPGGGDVKSIEDEQQQEIETKKIELNASSKVGSMDNVKHKPGGGDVKIFDDKEYLRQKTSGEQSALSGSQSSLRSQPEPAEPVSDENLNQER